MQFKTLFSFTALLWKETIDYLESIKRLLTSVKEISNGWKPGSLSHASLFPLALINHKHSTFPIFCSVILDQIERDLDSKQGKDRAGLPLLLPTQLHGTTEPVWLESLWASCHTPTFGAHSFWWSHFLLTFSVFPASVTFIFLKKALYMDLCKDFWTGLSFEVL